MARIVIYDTTLRDGSQTQGVSFSVKDKIKITEKLDDLGVHYIEGGWPGANPKDTEYFRYFKGKKLKNAIITAFSMTRRAGATCENDANIQELLRSGAQTVTIVGKSWDMQVLEIVKTTLEENLKMISESVAYLKKNKREVIYDAEHFFDGFKRNPEYALKAIQSAAKAGADCIVLCDTNGGTLTEEVSAIVAKVKSKIKTPLGIHCHHDLELGVANSIAAVKAGCVQVQGTFNGLGERCGNANLVTIIGILQTKLRLQSIPEKNIKKLMTVAYTISEISNMPIPNNAAFIGHSAFAHKGGMHIDAILKNPLAYEHIDPAVVGNHRRLITSDLAGKMPIVMRAEKIGVKIDKKSPEAIAAMKILQDKESEGYQFEAADASFELFIKRYFTKYPKFFELEDYKVETGKDKNGKIFADVQVDLKINGKSGHYGKFSSSGPVDALDGALRKALTKLYPALSDMHLSDYKVRVLNTKDGAAAKVRVLIESQDDHGSWTTVGVHENIIEASWEALVDSIEYKLLKDTDRK